VRVTITGASGLIGQPLVEALRARGDDVTILSRDPERGVTWDALSEPAPHEALSGRDAVIHLAGENVAQRWTDSAKRSIRESRVIGTQALLEGLRASAPRPGVLVCASAVGYYGDRGDEVLDEDSPPGTDWLAGVCVEWEAAAREAEALGMRVCSLRTGVVLSRHGGALAKMLPPFRLGLGGPVAGGDQYTPWIHLDDIVGLYLAAVDGPAWSRPVNATGPAPVTNREFSKALGRAVHRPAVAPVPRLAVRALFGEMAEIVTGGQRAIPRRAAELGYEFRHPKLDAALADVLGD
jgi:uncharacterized protein